MMMNMIARCAATALLLLTLPGCSVTSQPRNTVLAPEQQQLGKRRIYTSATAPTPQEAVQNVIAEGTGAVPVVLIKSEKLFVQHVYDVQASFDSCMSLMSDRVSKAKSEGDNPGRRAYYCVPIDNGRPGSPTLVSTAEG
jgi:hypothetical protein